MKNTRFACNLKGVNQVVIAFFLLLSPLAIAHATCCAGHGGVTSCNKSTGHQMCKDGTASPTCMCTAPKTSTKSSKAKSTTTTTPATTTTTTTTTKPKHSWFGFGGKSKTTTTSNTKSTSTSTKSAKGCCSSHGGVAQCNKSTGHQMCKDGTASPTCTCQ